MKRTPCEVVFTQRNVGLLDNPLTREIVALNRDVGHEEEKESIGELLEANRAKMQEQFDKKRKIAYEYKPRDLVMVISSTSAATGESRKLSRQKNGPYAVVKVLENDRYLIRDIEGERTSQKPYEGILSAKRLELIPKQSA